MRKAREKARKGSSPRVRGRLRANGEGWETEGLIPAGAGQTTEQWFRSLTLWAHPRGCGADEVCPPQLVPGAGSSPRVRGRQCGNSAGPAPVGLIPAGAGQTLVNTVFAVSPRAHPRGCGADTRRETVCPRYAGSSPRVRGRPNLLEFDGDAIGLIPAGAGQTPSAKRAGERARAHPRGCGADAGEPSARQVGVGSSPRVRGRLAQPRHHGVRRRLIPAGAGQTPSAKRAGERARAHPRGCGADPCRPAT